MAAAGARARSRSRSPPGAAAAGAAAAGPAAFVDTHCHLEEVLQLVRQYEAVPSLRRACGASPPIGAASGAAEEGLQGLRPEEVEHWRALGWVSAEGDEAPSSETNPTWGKTWEDLAPAQREAAVALGWEEESWRRNRWPVPKRLSWEELGPERQGLLGVLGESAGSWDGWTSGAAPAAASVSPGFDAWGRLRAGQRRAAEALGFTAETWELRDPRAYDAELGAFCGPGFEACVTQGCDVDSLGPAERLALEHPRVFASFGCHPKGSWLYSDELEQRFLAAYERCGTKAVAWGEFGLDYSHAVLGRMASNRRSQRSAFGRQLQLAVGRGFPLVLHTREAERDTLRMLRRWVPRDWKMHLHSFRGGATFFRAILEGWPNAFFGFSGLVSMPDRDAQEVCRGCPLERLLLETDAPYLPMRPFPFSQPGHIPAVAACIARLKGLGPDGAGVVLAAARANARTMYGI